MKKITLAFIISLLSIPSLSAQDCVPDDKVFKTTIMGRDYEFIAVKKNWDDANDCARERGGYLLDIQSQQENDSLMHFFLFNLRTKFSFNLIAQGEDQVWLGAKVRYDSSDNQAAKLFWEWYNTPYSKESNLLTTQLDYRNPSAEDSFEHNEDIFINWGETISGYYFPRPFETPFQESVAITLLEIRIDQNDEKVADPGTWITTFSNEEKYFMIDYGCINPIKTVIDTLVCVGNAYPFGDSTITKPGFYSNTFESFSNCDSVVELTIDFALINNEITREEDRLLSKELSASSYQRYRCDTDTPIDGANTFFLTIDETGSYRLELEKNGCDFVTDCYDYCFPTTHTIDTVKCENESITINGQEYASKGFYSQTLKQVGFDCDSTLEINIKDIAFDKRIRKSNDTLISFETGAEYQWYNCEGDVLIADATQKEYAPTEDGEYKVEIMKEGCIDFSQCISFSTSTNSVKDIQDSDNIRLDLDNNLIVFDNIKLSQIELLDMNSKTIYKTDQFSQSINIEYLNTGVYFLKVVNGNDVVIFKFMVVE